MSDAPESLVRTAATFGIVIGGPVALFTGMIVLSRLAGHTPRLLVAVFVFAVATAILSVVAFLADHAKRR